LNSFPTVLGRHVFSHRPENAGEESSSAKVGRGRVRAQPMFVRLGKGG
jgi:hypothetical protein